MDLQGWLTVVGGVLTTLAVAFTAWLNQRAHQGTATRIDGVKEGLTSRIDGLEQGLTSRIDGLEQGLTSRINAVEEGSRQRDEARRRGLESIGRDVAFLAGRQAERDQRERRRDRQPAGAGGKRRRAP